MSLHEDLTKAKDAYYATMVDGVEAISYEAHDAALEHLQAIARRCIEAGECLDDAYVLHYRASMERNALLRSINRHARINTIGQLRALTQDLPDSFPLIHTTNDTNVIGYNLLIGQWIYKGEGGQDEEGFAVRLGPCSQSA